MSTTSYYRADYGTASAKRVFGEPRGFKASRPCRVERTMVPVDPLRPLLAELIEVVGLTTVAALAGLNPRTLHRVMKESKSITLGLADRLITDALDDPSLWQTLPGLVIYDHYTGVVS